MSMTRFGNTRRGHIDLATARETLCLIQDDLAREPDLATIAAAIGKAVAEIDRVATPRATAPAGHLASLFGSSFRPWKPEV